MNHCGTCGLELPDAEFDADTRRVNGLSSRCKECRRACGRAYTRRKREGLVIVGRRYRASAGAAFVHWLLSEDCGRWIGFHTAPFRANLSTSTDIFAQEAS